MRDRTEPVGAHRPEIEHVGVLESLVEDELEVLDSTAWSDRPVALPPLDLVQALLSLSLERLGEDRAVAERARADLPAPLDPREHLARFERSRDLGFVERAPRPRLRVGVAVPIELAARIDVPFDVGIACL